MNRRSLFAATLTLAAAAVPYTGAQTAWASGHDEKPATAIAKGGTICAVTGEEIADAKNAPGGKAAYKGKTYYFCCPGCAPKFAKEPAKYAKLADLRLEKIAMTARMKAIDSQMKNLEKPAAAKVAVPPAAKAEAVKTAAALHCAITDEAIASAKDAAGSALVNGKTYYFCCPGCVAKFKADPAKFAAQADKRNAARK